MHSVGSEISIAQLSNIRDFVWIDRDSDHIPQGLSELWGAGDTRKVHISLASGGKKIIFKVWGSGADFSTPHEYEASINYRDFSNLNSYCAGGSGQSAVPGFCLAVTLKRCLVKTILGVALALPENEDDEIGLSTTGFDLIKATDAHPAGVPHSVPVSEPRSVAAFEAMVIGSGRVLSRGDRDSDGAARGGGTISDSRSPSPAEDE